MIDPELLTKLNEIDEKVEKAYKAAESARKYLFWTGVVSIAFIVFPLIGLAFVIPAFLNNYLTPLTTMTGNASPTLNMINSLGL